MRAAGGADKDPGGWPPRPACAHTIFWLGNNIALKIAGVTF